MRAVVFLFSFAVVLIPMSVQGQVLISEYIEGSSSNKAIEVANIGTDPIPLADLVLERYNNGSLTVTDSYTLSESGLVTLAPGEAFVVANPSANATILAEADDTDEITFYNGDDAVALLHSGVIVDLIGEIGVDPGSGWTVGTGATNNFTLVRDTSICVGNTAGSQSPDWDTEWTVQPIDYSDDLGSQSHLCNWVGSVLISEYIEGSSSNKAIEVLNAGGTDIPLTALVLERYNNGSLTVTDSYTLSESGLVTLAPGEVFVVANPSANPMIMAEADDIDEITFYNGDDAVALLYSGVIVDLIGEIGVDPGSGWTVGTGATNNYTLVRDTSICFGNIAGSQSPNWDIEWTVLSIDNSDELGLQDHDCVVPVELQSFTVN